MNQTFNECQKLKAEAKIKIIMIIMTAMAIITIVNISDNIKP